MGVKDNWFSFVMIAVPIGCAILAARGFKGRELVVGIDLGTTYSVVGVNQGGNVRMIANERGSFLVPSMVSFTPQGDVLVGAAAKRALTANPTRTIYNAKRFIGRQWSDASVAADQKLHDFSVVPGPDPTNASRTVPYFSIDIEGQAAPRLVSPVEVGSLVLKELLRMAAQFLGHAQVSGAVVTVPADFDAAQRAATVEAFRGAGLKVQRMLEEPTAAALAYGLNRKPDVHHVLVYDLGGGTLDVSLLFVNDGACEVIAKGGDNHLGGEDFDELLRVHLNGAIEAQTGFVMPQRGGAVDTAADAREDAEEDRLDAAAVARAAKAAGMAGQAGMAGDVMGAMMGGGGGGAPSIMSMAGGVGAGGAEEDEEDEEAAAAAAAATAAAAAAAEKPKECTVQWVKKAAEELKIALSSRGEASVTCVASRAPQPARARATVTLTRAAFEALASALFARAIVPMQRVLAETGMTTADIDEVVLVGGSSRIPYLRRKLGDLFGKRPNAHIDPDVAVAYGAARIID